VLGAAQRLRYRQLVLQQVERYSAERTGQHLVWAIREVAAGLKLTQEQAEKLSKSGDARRILSPEQQGRWKEMKGDEYTGMLSIGIAGRRGNEGRATSLALPARYAYLADSAVQKELKLTSEQAGAVDAVAARWRELTKDHGTWKPEERGARLAKAAESLEAQLGQVLQPSW
jgi:hypothetical protein